MARVSFGSDNHSGIHPTLLKALLGLEEKYAPSYEMDELSQQLKDSLRNSWNCADVHLVFNGTAANVLGLSTAVRSFESVICTEVAHLQSDECGAPEKILGIKLVPVPHRHGKLSVSDVEAALSRRGDQHCNQVKMVSITQPTELGTVYSMNELRALRELCDREKLYLHIDGARMGNACLALGCDFKDILQWADVASVGGTKNGLLFGELVVINRTELADGFKYRRKQAMQLASKTRYMAAQFQAYFQNQLWREIASHQCQMAQYLAQQLREIGLPVNYPVESNGVFCILPRKLVKPLREEFFFYVWDEDTFECRLMTSFSTTQEEVDHFVIKLKTLKEQLDL